MYHTQISNNKNQTSKLNFTDDRNQRRELWHEKKSTKQAVEANFKKIKTTGEFIL